MSFIIKSLLLATLVASAIYIGHQNEQNYTQNLVSLFKDPIVLTPVKEGKEVGIIIISGAQCTQESYLPLAQEIQKANDLSLYIGIPSFLVDTPEPLEFDSAVKSAISAMKSKGMKTDEIVFVAHSLGGVMLAKWAESNKDKIKSIILMGSFLERKRFTISDEGEHILNWEIPTLTIAAELDGLARVFRMAEASFKQKNYENMPVVLVKGASHMQFASGPPPQNVKNNDLVPEITEKEAHSKISQIINKFLVSQESDAKKHMLNDELTESNEFFAPIIKAYELEGFYNFKPACNRQTLVNEADKKCTHGSPWVEYGQSIMSKIQGKTKLVVDDNAHRVYTIAPVHLPEFENKCDGQSECTLNAISVSEAFYDRLDPLDTGLSGQSAYEIKAKLSSRQMGWQHNGNSTADFEELDGGKRRCAEINEESYKWALKNAGADTLKRYNKSGIKMEFADDDGPWNAGPLWIWKYTDYKVSKNSKGEQVMTVTAPFMATPTDYKIQAAAGFHYCKLMSPARALEHIYIDSMKQPQN